MVNWEQVSAWRESFLARVNGGVVLVVVAFITLIIANSPLVDIYNGFLALPLTLDIGGVNILETPEGPMTILDAVNDGLMTIFFFSVGLEIKKEILVGELASPRKAMLPIVAACGGMIMPVLLFLILHPSEPAETVRGCAIPMATDIAFSLGVLSMLGKRVPLSLKIFLTTLAVADDIGGILVIAICYSEHIEIGYLLLSLIPIAILFFAGRIGVYSRLFYFIMAAIVWYLFMHSGIHATISGVVVAFLIPAHTRKSVRNSVEKIRELLHKLPTNTPKDPQYNMLTNSEIRILRELEYNSEAVISPLQSIYNTLDPLVAFIIMPIFAFANAGINFSDIPLSGVMGLPLTIALSLVIGKTIGIFGFTMISVKTGLLKMPMRMNAKNLFGVSIIGGIGFTVSLFIANLAYGDINYALLNESKLGIIAGSLIAGVIGYFVLNKMLDPVEVYEPVKKRKPTAEEV